MFVVAIKSFSSYFIKVQKRVWRILSSLSVQTSVYCSRVMYGCNITLVILMYPLDMTEFGHHLNDNWLWKCLVESVCAVCRVCITQDRLSLFDSNRLYWETTYWDRWSRWKKSEEEEKRLLTCNMLIGDCWLWRLIHFPLTCFLDLLGEFLFAFALQLLQLTLDVIVEAIRWYRRVQ